WKVNFENKFDIIVSDGWNGYENVTKDDAANLYDNLYKALKPGGLLITNILTPTPDKANCTWNMDFIKKEDIRKEIILFAEIFDGKWANNYTFDEIKVILGNIGFSEIESIYDRARMCP